MSAAAWGGGGENFGCRIAEALACSALSDGGLFSGAYGAAARFGGVEVWRGFGMRGWGFASESECASLLEGCD